MRRYVAYLASLAPLQRVMLMVAGATAVALAVVTFAVHDAKHRILQALGPRTTVGSIRLAYPTVTLRDVHIAADSKPGAWPAKEEFQAALVEVRIDASSLWAYRQGKPLVIDSVRVEDGTMVMRRTRDGMDMLPALRETTRADAVATADSLIVRKVQANRLAVDLYDMVPPDGNAPYLMRFRQVHGQIGDIALPMLDHAIQLDASGNLQGPEREGTAWIKGTLTPARQDAELSVGLHGADMTALQPYVIRFGDDTVSHGTLDLAITAHVAQRQIDAPGRLTLTGLAFDRSGRFAGIGRRAVLAALTRDGRIDLAFTAQGTIADPHYALAEPVAPRVAAGAVKVLGSGVKDVAEGVGGIVKGLLGGKRDDTPMRAAPPAPVRAPLSAPRPSSPT